MSDFDITEEDIFNAITQAHQDNGEIEPGTFTSGEYAKYKGFSKHRALRHIRAAIEAGKVQPEQIRRRNIQGCMVTVWGYRWVN